MKTFLRRLEVIFPPRLHKTSSRRLQESLGQDQYIHLGRKSSRRLQGVLPRCLQDVFRTSSRRLAKIYSRRLQNVFKKSYKNVFKMSSRHLQNLFKTSSKRLAKTSSRYLQDVLQRCLQDVFKTYHQVKLFLLIHQVLQRRLSTEGLAWFTLLRNLYSVYKFCESDKI